MTALGFGFARRVTGCALAGSAKVQSAMPKKVNFNELIMLSPFRKN
jgi:hypothetical protein